MKIAMIGHKRIPSREGGIEVVVEELSTRMVVLGHKVCVYNRRGYNVGDKNADLEKHKLKEYKGVRIKSVYTIENKNLNAILYSINATICAIFKHYDIIHFHAEGPCALIPLAHYFKIHTVATIHGLDWQRTKWSGFATRFLLFGEKMAAKYADEVIVLSKNVNQYFTDTYGRETNYIPNGVNIPDCIPADIIFTKYGLQKDNYILFLARLVPEKGVHYLLDAYKNINTNIKLVIAGGTSHTDEYVELIKEKASRDKRVVMTGFVQGIELQELFSNCAIYVLPSDIEGMPISLLEALSYGCKCLVSDIPENLEVTHEYAISFKKSDVDDLRNKLEILLLDKNFDNSNAIAYVKQNYDWDVVVDKTLELYMR